MRVPGVIMLLYLLGSFVGCSDGAGNGGPGKLTYRLDSPNGDEAGFLVEISGALTGVPWAPGARSEALDMDGKVILAVVAQEPGQLQLVLAVEDKEDPPDLLILQVVGPDNRLRSNLADYSFRRGE